MSPPAIVATDLDGTLIRSDGTVSERTRRALRRVREHGGTVVFVTGRPIRVMADVVAQTSVAGIAVCANGALVYDLDAEVMIDQRGLDPAAALRLALAIREIVPEAAFAVESGIKFGREPLFRTMWPDPDEVVADVAELLLTLPPAKLLVRRGGESLADMYEKIVALAGTEAMVTRSTETLVEIAGAGVSKAVALAQVAATRGVTAADVVAFGDMLNDLPMLAWAGYAVAVANAHPDVLAAADEITASNDNDGVALVLERLFP
ncbi:MULTISPECIES: HAD family hydrolase [unclassified Pseudofrankia]|uniref:HAD family hydrolase n=1 Tax=unclassified Pseudofrankia TaxID=2994372 RepID=UPI0008D9F905|nr:MULTISPECIES: HAD family hydrolase [unclassified Pseudofrankia]MDT3441801.1 HAD family hydrolase [Pseudofrankia sp. BMG5.37]OHV47089.1 haloacid dehalogenase [Pseudofrankia sp. BMG5.36]